MTKVTVHIRRMTEADDPQLAALRREVAKDNSTSMEPTLDEELSGSFEAYRAQLALPEPHTAFGAFLQDQLVGLVVVTWPGALAVSRHKAVLWGVVVLPHLRRHGLARRLVQCAIDHAFEQGAQRILLQVLTPQEAVLPLYRSLGFQPCEPEPDAVYFGGSYQGGIFMGLSRSDADDSKEVLA